MKLEDMLRNCICVKVMGLNPKPLTCCVLCRDSKVTAKTNLNFRHIEKGFTMKLEEMLRNWISLKVMGQDPATRNNLQKIAVTTRSAAGTTQRVTKNVLLYFHLMVA